MIIYSDIFRIEIVKHKLKGHVSQLVTGGKYFLGSSNSGASTSMFLGGARWFLPSHVYRLRWTLLFLIHTEHKMPEAKTEPQLGLLID